MIGYYDRVTLAKWLQKREQKKCFFMQPTCFVTEYLLFFDSPWFPSSCYVETLGVFISHYIQRHPSRHGATLKGKRETRKGGNKKQLKARKQLFGIKIDALATLAIVPKVLMRTYDAKF